MDPDWSHAYLVPLISGFYIYVNREHILKQPVKRSWLGLPIMICGMVTYFIFTLSNLPNHTVQGFGMIICLLGVVLFMLGRQMWKALLFPQLYLLLGVRLPPPLMMLITPTLQRWAAVGSFYLLNVIGYQTEIQGNVLTIFHGSEIIPLNIAEACSGMRMIIGFLALGVAIAFLSTNMRLWQRIVLICMAVPVAVIINILRVATIGIMSTFNRDWASGEAHMFLGMLWLLPAFGLYMGIAWLLQHIVIYDEQHGNTPPAVPKETN